MSTAPTSPPPPTTPTVAPPQRDPADVAPADSYHPADRVWVYRDGWRAGVIEAASPRAVTVTYRPGAHRGTGVDTFTAPYVSVRSSDDPLDRRGDRNLVGRRMTPAGLPVRGSAA
ncbi:hypothetical protein GCM10010172_51540 [Paractinoplanes ferrugineus]|uniref:Uncharacterized protein n=1 Tax=Paractinoplanes ferrugineus TaxID=113564 RepID=A0A919J227_9ACTN|nr:hypothetical protein [Actinoplanes ferrugineus]GIE12027.1 hypothetical protein Afe05nite_38670 [Actinoplanes ferrugineus]